MSLNVRDLSRLDPRERSFLIAGPHPTLKLFLRHLPALNPSGTARRPVLYVHGATFPSACSVAHRFDGVSWPDALNEAGFDVWALDFQGFGYSDRYEVEKLAEDHPPLCSSEDAGEQVEAAARFIVEHQGVSRLSMISHSWGSMAAGRFAGKHPAMVDRWVLFGPVARRPPRRYALPGRAGESSRLRINGPDLSRTCRQKSAPFCRGGILTSGRNVISTATQAVVIGTLSA